MTSWLTLAVAAAALALGAVSAWHTLRSPPELEGERWFKVMLATLLRGEVAARHGDPKEWDALVVRHVPYHPAGRDPERKLVNPEAYTLPIPPLDGERQLVAALALENGLSARYSRLYDTDEKALDARLSDPQELGPAYDPSDALGPEATWDAVAAWTPALVEALDRRAPWTWLLVQGGGPAQPLLDALALALEGRATRVEAGKAAVLQALEQALPTADRRAVLVLSGEALLPGLQALHDDWRLRSRVVAVVALGCPIGAKPASTWLQEHFRHEGMDVEANRATPYISVQIVDRAWPVPGVPGLPLRDQRFPVPMDEGGRRHSLDRVDFGLLPVLDDMPALAVGRALWLTVSAWVLARR